jgi:drug/metabolite transporter (DMT)-like permease
LAFSGVIGISVADTLFFMGLNRLGAGLNSVVMCLYFPIITAFAHVFLGEELPWVTVLGAALVITGILVGSDVHRVPGADWSQIAAGVLFGVFALLSMAAGVVAMRPIITSEPVLWTTTARLVAGTIPLLIIVWFGPDRDVFGQLMRPTPLWRYALPGAVLGGALSMLAWIAGFALTEASRAAILNQLSTIFVFVLAAVVLKEPVTPRRILAIVLAFAGALIVIASQ